MKSTFSYDCFVYYVVKYFVQKARKKTAKRCCKKYQTKHVSNKCQNPTSVNKLIMYELICN